MPKPIIKFAMSNKYAKDLNDQMKKSAKKEDTALNWDKRSDIDHPRNSRK